MNFHNFFSDIKKRIKAADKLQNLIVKNLRTKGAGNGLSYKTQGGILVVRTYNISSKTDNATVCCKD